LRAAQDAGVDYVQGHFFGEPIELDSLDWTSLLDQA